MRHKELLTRLDKLEVSVVSQDRVATAVFTGSAVQAATALSSVYPHLSQTLSRIAAGSDPYLSSEDALWLQLEFEGLLADAWKAAADEIAKSAIQPARNLVTSANPRHPQILRPTHPALREKHPPRFPDIPTRFVLHGPDRGGVNERVLEIGLPSGRLSIAVTTGRQTKSGQFPRGNFQTARISFVPHAGWHLSGLTATFMRDFGVKAKIRPELSTFSVQPVQSPIFTYIASGDLMKVREMLVTGKASPNDRDSDGNSLLTVWYLTVN